MNKLNDCQTFLVTPYRRDFPKIQFTHRLYNKVICTAQLANTQDFSNTRLIKIALLAYRNIVLLGVLIKFHTIRIISGRRILHHLKEKQIVQIILYIRTVCAIYTDNQRFRIIISKRNISIRNNNICAVFAITTLDGNKPFVRYSLHRRHGKPNVAHVNNDITPHKRRGFCLGTLVSIRYGKVLIDILGVSLRHDIEAKVLIAGRNHIGFRNFFGK